MNDTTHPFTRFFGRPPQAHAQAPGRINLIGDHTDYNDGFVLPIAIPQCTQVSVARAEGGLSTVHAADLQQTARFTLADADAAPELQFARYVYGSLKEAAGEGVEVPALDIHVHSSVPMGVGLSSSASLEVAVLRALRALLGVAIDDVRIALLAQQAEIRHAGVNCGVMDQMASSLADTANALFIDTRSLQRERVPLPAGSAVLALDSGVARTLAGSGYNERRAQCEEAARQLGVASLRDIGDVTALAGLPGLLQQRARHVVTENQRVLQAAKAGVSAADFGALMNASHASLRDDYAVSVPPVDALVALLQQAPGVHGARMTGGGFGGACVVLCDAAAAGQIAAPVLAAYAERTGQRGRQLVPLVADGQA